MAAESTLKQFRLEATCFICSGYFMDPFILDCGHNFCHTCLFDCWRDFLRDHACPQCKQTVESRNVIQNEKLASLVDLIKQLSEEATQVAEKVYVCPKHQAQEPLKLFCKNELTLLCSACEQSLEHQAHNVVPVEEAAAEFKHSLLMCIAPLKEEREKIMAHRVSAEECHERLLRETEEGKQNFVASFKEFYRFLAQQEHLLLTKFQTLKDEIVKKNHEYMARLFDDIASCNRITQELEEKCRQPTCDFLQDIQGTMERFVYNARSEDPVLVAPELKWERVKLCDFHPFLKSIMQTFKDTWRLGLQVNKANVTLDEDTAHPRVILSPKDMRLGDEAQIVPRNRLRFSECFFVLGSQEFAAGRHFWDVLVQSEDNWAVGVAKKSVKRRGQVSVRPQAGIWAVGKWEGLHVAFSPPAFPCLPSSAEVKRVRVLLNCEGRRVTFLDADRATVLFATFVTSATQETFFPFFRLSEKAHLTIAP